jgi:hypothetical protein
MADVTRASAIALDRTMVKKKLSGKHEALRLLRRFRYDNREAATGERFSTLSRRKRSK